MRTALVTAGLLLAAACASDADRAYPGGRPDRPPLVRVLLTSPLAAETVEVAAPGRARLVESATGRVLEERSGFSRSLSVGGSSIEGTLRLTSDARIVKVGSRSYRGDLLLFPSPGGVRLVIETDLESYLPGVMAGELWASFPPAAIRAQAVAARTYALFQLGRRTPERPWDLRDDHSSQVFVGITGKIGEPFRRAVADTRGMVLEYRGRPFCTYFHSTCGGHTAAADVVFGGPLIPPLVGVPCTFCTVSKRYRWDGADARRFPLAAVRAKLGLPAPPRAVEVARRGRDGRALALRFLCPAPVEIRAADVRMRLGPKNFYSTLISDVRVTDTELVVSGKGWGHGVGLCQIGALGMARAGAGAADILTHYYPGAELTRLY